MQGVSQPSILRMKQCPLGKIEQCAQNGVPYAHHNTIITKQGNDLSKANGHIQREQGEWKICYQLRQKGSVRGYTKIKGYSKE